MASNSKGIPPAPRSRMAYGDADGFGTYGVLNEDDDGLLLCHMCGNRLAHLGLHVYKAHGIKAADYRREHGLRPTRGLVSSSIREKIQREKARTYTSTGALAALHR
ncbi:MAG: hypothetical protein WBG76_17950, partial [Ornithinimicrobium sp.]